MIERWQEGSNSLDKYLSKLLYFGAFIGILKWYVTFVCCLACQMPNIYLEERKKKWDKI